MHKLGKCTVLVGAALTLGFETGAISPKSVEAATIVLNQTGFTGEALEALNFGVDVWSRYLNSPVPIRITATYAPLSEEFGEGTLAVGGAIDYQANFNGAIPGFFYPEALADAISGTNLDPTIDDMALSFNSAISDWYFGTDPNAKQPEQVDFISTVIHEIAHGLGFQGSAGYDTATGIGTLGFDAGELGVLPNIYDRFVVNGSGENITQFPNNSVELGNQLVSNNLFFNGPNAIAANGGERPRLYAPTTWTNSSYAHLDQDTYDFAGSLNVDMVPRDSREAVPARVPGPITLGIFQDQGWSVNVNGVPPTPVPFNSSPTLGLLLVGLGGAASKLKKHWKQKKSIKSIEPVQKSA